MGGGVSSISSVDSCDDILGGGLGRGFDSVGRTGEVLRPTFS